MAGDDAQFKIATLIGYKTLEDIVLGMLAWLLEEWVEGMFEGFPNFGTEQAGAYMRFLFSLHHLGNK
jgi:hypothetical protein